MNNTTKGESKQLGSANKMIWEYFEVIRDIIRDAMGLEGQKNLQRKALSCIFMGIAIVETFFNAYFRILAEEASYSNCREQTLKELDENTSLDKKVRTWPKRFFNTEIDFGQGIGQRFMRLKDLRNKLMHFRSSYETVELPGVQIQGLADITAYESLDSNVALESLGVAEEMIEEIFRLKGVSPDQIKHHLHFWTGKPPVFDKIKT